MKKKHIVLFGSLLFIIFLWLNFSDFTRSKRLRKTNYYLVESIASTWGLYYQYPEMKGTCVGVLHAYVTEVYWDSQYILANSYCIRGDSIEGYYIVKNASSGKKRSALGKNRSFIEGRI